MNISRHKIRGDQLKQAFEALDGTIVSRPWCISVVYTRQPGGTWFFYLGQFATATEDVKDCIQQYADIAFVRKIIPKTSGGELLDALFEQGIQVSPASITSHQGQKLKFHRISRSLTESMHMFDTRIWFQTMMSGVLISPGAPTYDSLDVGLRQICAMAQILGYPRTLSRSACCTKCSLEKRASPQHL